MEVPRVFYNSGVFGIDPQTVEIGYRLPEGDALQDSQFESRVFVAQDWGRTGTFVQMGDVLEIVEGYMDQLGMRLTGVNRNLTIWQIESGNTHFMSSIARPMVQDLHQRGTEFGHEQYDPKRRYLFGPLARAKLADILALAGGVSLWGESNSAFYTRSQKPWVLYHQRDSLYVPS